MPFPNERCRDTPGQPLILSAATGEGAEAVLRALASVIDARDDRSGSGEEGR